MFRCAAAVGAQMRVGAGAAGGCGSVARWFASAPPAAAARPHAHNRLQQQQGQQVRINNNTSVVEGTANHPLHGGHRFGSFGTAEANDQTAGTGAAACRVMLVVVSFAAPVLTHRL